ncbi:MAG: 30S ribosomal protein S2 [Candidatus Diapherotrites archaeon]|nr:30S ribosomal protein S2 [Candidatus Diapherotrites archaeon]
MTKKPETNPEENMLVLTEKYLKTGSHIGTKFKSGDMKKFIFKTRKDGLKVLDIPVIDERIKIAAKFIAKHTDKPEEIVVVSRKLYGHTPSQQFAKLIGAHFITGRFVPGTFTNSSSRRFIEPKMIIITEPESDGQAIKEANIIRVPVIALCSTNNSFKDTDLVIPVNNKGRKSLALVYWLLAREYFKEKGIQINEKDFEEKLELFEQQVKEVKERPQQEQRPRHFRGRKPQRRD